MSIRAKIIPLRERARSASLHSAFDVQRSMFDVSPNPQSAIHNPQFSFRTPHSALRAARAFTLLELMVVIVIIGLLATIGLPSIRNMSKSNSMIAANRQLLDDIAFARRSAIANHTTVYMVFVPPTIYNSTNLPTDATALPVYSNLCRGQCTTYALIALRSVGDQPGASTPRYITGWRSLPNGVFIATNKFLPYAGINGPNNTTNDYVRAFPTSTISFPFPLLSTNGQYQLFIPGLPYVGFNYLGQLISPNFESEAIPLARGSIFYTPDANGVYQPQAADIQENPPSNSITESNIIHIDWLTGKARIERQEIQ